jgi:hypothetical protein
MKYAFVCATILVIWVAIVLMSVVSNQPAGSFLHETALILTVILFAIGFRNR